MPTATAAPPKNARRLAAPWRCACGFESTWKPAIENHRKVCSGTPRLAPTRGTGVRPPTNPDPADRPPACSKCGRSRHHVRSVPDDGFCARCRSSAASNARAAEKRAAASATWTCPKCGRGDLEPARRGGHVRTCQGKAAGTPSASPEFAAQAAAPILAPPESDVEIPGYFDEVYAPPPPSAPPAPRPTPRLPAAGRPKAPRPDAARRLLRVALACTAARVARAVAHDEVIAAARVGQVIARAIEQVAEIEAAVATGGSR